jgi:hypothetical protein
MLNLISLSLAMYPWFNDAEKVNNLKKCTISGNIIEINIIYDYDYSITNCDIIDLLVR